MNFSISSLFITLINSFILIILFHFILSHKRSYKWFRCDLLIVLSFIIILRLSLPIEYPFTISLYIPEIMNPIQTVLNTNFFRFSIWRWFCIIWAIGSIVGFIRYFYQLYKVHIFYKQIIKECNKTSVSEFMQIEDKYNYQVWISNFVPTPMVLGIKKVILLPNINFTKMETENILSHEIQHIQNYDIVIKTIINILAIIYWWFIPVYYLNKLVQCALEIRADYKATSKMSILIADYAQTLISIKRKMKCRELNQFIIQNANCFIFESNKILEYRINYLMESNFKKRTSKFLLYAILLLPLLTNTIILEPFHKGPQTDNIFDEEDLIQRAYLIDNKDGSYTIYIDGQEGIINDPQPFLDMEIPVVERENLENQIN